MDEIEIKDVLEKFYSIISGRKEDKRKWEKFREMFVPDASLSIFSKDSQLNTLSVEKYIERLEEFLSENDFFESSEILNYNIVGNIAQIKSIYKAKRSKEDSDIIKEGTNFIQFVREENRWKIINMLWEDN
jgi:hypothetical protein